MKTIGPFVVPLRGYNVFGFMRLKRLYCNIRFNTFVAMNG